MRARGLWMEHVRLQAMLTAERRELLEFLRTLAPEDWLVPSLCEGWLVRDVVAHLLWDDIPVPHYLRVAATHRNPDRVNQHLVDEARALSVTELLARFESVVTAGGWLSRIAPGGMLADLVVHQQDIRRPLQRPRTVDPRRLRHALDQPNPFGRPQRYRHGLAFIATDIAWTRGTGPAVRGTAEALALASVGRGVVLDELEGDGVDELAARIGRTLNRTPG